MVDLYVGGIGTTDRMALSDSVEDAVLNCRSAAADGVGYAANYEGLRAFNKILSKYDNEFIEAEKAYENNKEDVEIAKERIRTFINKEVASVIAKSYIELCVQIYLPYCDDEKNDAINIVAMSLANTNKDERKPFNILTEKYDDLVLTSIKTEPAILEAISRIITTLYNTNQFLVPDPRFNIYQMSEEDEIIKMNLAKQHQPNSAVNSPYTAETVSDAATKLSNLDNVEN
jgi:hypothetical protein